MSRLLPPSPRPSPGGRGRKKPSSSRRARRGESGIGVACYLLRGERRRGVSGSAAAEPNSLLARADLYERLYRRSLRTARVQLDLDGDGIADEERSLGVVELQRG